MNSCTVQFWCDEFKVRNVLISIFERAGMVSKVHGQERSGTEQLTDPLGHGLLKANHDNPFSSNTCEIHCDPIDIKGAPFHLFKDTVKPQRLRLKPSLGQDTKEAVEEIREMVHRFTSCWIP